MDPEQLFLEDQRVITTIRPVGFIVSELLGVITFLIYFGVLDVSGVILWACWPVGIGMVLLGFLQGFWNPYTRTKVLFYVYAYCVLGALMSVLVTGMQTVIFLSWLLLIVVMVVYFGRKVALVGMTSMSLSAVAWLLLRASDHSVGTVVDVLGSAAVVVSVALVVSVIWQFTIGSIHKLRQSRVKEKLERQRLASLINSVADAVIAVDENAKVILYNAGALNIFDINNITIGMPIGSILKPVDKQDQPVDIVNLVKQTRAPFTNRDYRLKYGDGSVANIYLSIAPVRLNYGEKGERGYVLLLRDITREKSLEEERDEFISVVSHELRTPIAIAEGNIGNAEFIANKGGNATDVTKALKEAHSQTLFLSDMINDLATLSRAERGKLHVDIETIDVYKLGHELADNYRPQAEAKGLEFKLVLDPKLDSLHSSRLYVREVLENFITNAIKYTEKGTVVVQALSSPVGVYFAVADTGIGISKGDRERVFDKFFRSEDYRTRQANGTGLGLYVTTKLARLVHAELSLESELNKGTTFKAFFPNLR